MVAAIMAEPDSLNRAFLTGGATIQAADITDTMVNIGLSVVDSSSVRRAALGEALPTLENGLWQLQPDGRMQLTWRIRPGVTWHDGTPFTADDLVFTMQVVQDPAVPELRAVSADFVERIEVIDSRTVSTICNRPTIEADRLFAGGTVGIALPIPRHILERHYQENKEGFRQLAYWSYEHVGLGPYKLKEWLPGSHLTLQAHESYVLGRPKIDEIEVRFIQDPNAVMANILSGAIHTTLGTGLAVEQSLEVRDQWGDGRIEVGFENWSTIYPQFINPNPPIVADARFRRALLMAIDRQAMADAIQGGLAPVAHSYVRPDEPGYRETESFVVRYDYDPRRATQLIEELGYRKGGDGVFRDGAGDRLAVEARATTSPAIHTKSLFPVVDAWQRLGLAVDPLVIPATRVRDPEFRGGTHPAFEVIRHPNGPTQVQKLHSSEAPLPENRFVGRNRSRYMNPEFDGLIERYLATIPWEPRMQVLGQIVHHISDQLNVMPLFYDLRITLVSNRVANLAGGLPAWNAHEWELKE